MVQSDTDRKFSSGWLGAILALALLLPLAATAQESAAGDDPAGDAEDYDASQHVDESEENYRARMELRDQRYRDTPRMNTTYTPSSGTEIIDGLPLASQEHIKAQLRNMIIESRQWEPGEDLTDYPYEPSSEAQTNTPLRNKEREAWVEQLQKFQAREEAAYANAGDGQQGQSKQGQSNRGEAGQQNSEQGGAEKNSQLASDNAHSSAQGSASEPPPSTAGVSESALSFLQGRNGPGGPLDEGDAEAGDQEGSGEMQSELAASQVESRAGSQGDQENGEETGSEAAAVPGTLAIGDLAMLQGLNGQPGGTSLTASSMSSAGQQQGGAAEPMGSLDMGHPAGTRSGQEELQLQQQGAERAQPGTINLNDLQNLNQMAVQTGGQSSSASGEAPAADLSGGSKVSSASQPANPLASPPIQTSMRASAQASTLASAQASGAAGESSDSEAVQQNQEITETVQEVVVEPGTIDIAELELLEGN